MKTLMKSNNSLFPAFPSFMEDFFMRDLLGGNNGELKTSPNTLPAVNFSESNDAYVIELAAPGMKRGDFQVELDQHILTVSSARENKSENRQGTYTRKEFNYQRFQRSFALPENKIEGEKINARYSDGILYITVPKKEEAKVKPPKQIAIS